MSPLSEPPRVYEWLYGTLSAGTALASLVSTRIYRSRAPAGATFPYIVFRSQGGEDRLGVGGYRVFSDGEYVVRVTGLSANYAAVRNAADEMNTLIDGQRGAASGVTIGACYRVQPFELEESDEAGVDYAHIGGIYRIIAHTT